MSLVGAGVKLAKNTVVEIVGTRYNEQYKLELTELFRARDASCPKGKKMGERFRKIRICRGIKIWLIRIR